MRSFSKGLLGSSILALTLSMVACGAPTEEADDGEHATEAVGTKNLARQDFGLTDKQLILTLDDGPGPRTKELVDWLVEEQVPAVFFMMGNNAKANPDAMNYVAKRSHEVNGGLLIGNHSLTHTTPLPSQGVDGTVHEITATDAIIGDAMHTAQEQFDSQVPLFRPPYGAFTSLGAAKIEQVNARGGAKYMGPIFWDIGGELTDTHSADWACWGKVTPERCRNGYIAEAQLRGKGLMLIHDIHSKSVDMITGKGTANGVSLVKELKKLGFQFVGLRSHEAAFDKLAAGLVAETTTPDLLASAEKIDDGTIEVTIDLGPTHAVSGVVTFDADDDSQVTFRGATATVKRKLAPGQHTITISGLDAAGKVVRSKRVAIVVAAELEDGDVGSTGHAPCVNYDHLTVGRPFKLFIKKVDCSAANAVVAMPGECYAYNGDLKVAAAADGKAAVRATGGAEWSVEYDLSFKADANDNSKLSLVLETGTGNIITGKRHAYKDGRGAAVNRAETPFSQSAVDCNTGIWRGNFTYANGTKEAFLFRKPNANE